MMGKDLVQQGKTTGPEQTESRIQFTKLNDKRMDRLDKTFRLTEEDLAILKTIKKVQHWIVISEMWCGDAAIALPIINKIAEANSKIKLSILLRDENLEIMDLYLTSETRSIPKIIMLDQELHPIGIWGPRPAEAQQLMNNWKANPEGSKSEVLEQIQRWYLQDQGRQHVNEILGLLTQQEKTSA